MKKIFFLFAAVALFAACKNETKTAAASTDSVAMPYKASYSSKIALSDSPRYAQAVLQSYKDWEDNKLSNAPAYFADTVSWVFSNGVRHQMKRDSMVKFFQKDRDSLSSSKIDVMVFTNLRLVDRNEDWVNVWYKQTNTFKNGKVDSAFYEDDNLVKKGKIVYFDSKEMKLLKR